MTAPIVPSNCQQCPHYQQSLLGACHHTELALVEGGKMHQFYRKGQLIFAMGARAVGLYCVYEGKVKVSNRSADGKEQIIRLAREGDVLGYRSLMSGDICTTAATALTDCIVCLVPRPDFFSLLAQNPQFSQALLRLLARNLGDAEQRLLHSAYKPVRERVAGALLLLHAAFRPAAASAAYFSIPVSRDDLAALSGTTKETASRLLSEFRQEGLLTTQGSRISIRGLENLREVASLYD
ncbi:Crp/Fnr family transcriptional regulator [Hymenobacter aerophilus]|uniref:Crp/Fnr family transcriptional regulator n=1 Tax=Hymenobacter aerophilus TaxID=119644 RepID=UPI0009FD3427|nr:Crp/Fnr family transcriptional regulator [Hymenobacter aerophilus]